MASRGCRARLGLPRRAELHYSEAIPGNPGQYQAPGNGIRRVPVKVDRPAMPWSFADGPMAWDPGHVLNKCVLMVPKHPRITARLHVLAGRAPKSGLPARLPCWLHSRHFVPQNQLPAPKTGGPSGSARAPLSHSVAVCYREPPPLPSPAGSWAARRETSLNHHTVCLLQVGQRGIG